MKTELTHEESQHLIELGVPKEKAGWKFIHTVFGTTAMTPDYAGFGAENISSDIEEYKFKLEDFLNGEILPKKIPKKGSKKRSYKLNIRFTDNLWSTVCYMDISDNMDYYLTGTLKMEKELIDALYQLACWYYGEFLKNKNGK